MRPCSLNLGQAGLNTVQVRGVIELIGLDEAVSFTRGR